MNLGIEILIEIAIYLCEFLAQILCIHALVNRKIKINMSFLIAGISFVVILIMGVQLNASQVITLAPHIIMLTFVYYEFKIGIIDSVVVILLNLLISGSIQVAAALPLDAIHKIIPNDYLELLIIDILALCIMILICRIAKLDKLYSKAIKWDKTIVKTLGVVLFLFFYLYIRYKIEGGMILFAYFVSVITICVSVKISLNWSKDRYEVKQKNVELHMHELYGKTFEGMIENIRIRQHDFKNQLAAIYGMHLTAANFEELVENQKKYCNYLMEESRYDSILTKCNDKILAGFLYTKFTEWEKRGTDFRFDISLNDSNCRLATYELIEVSGVLIDNAAEAELSNNLGGIVEFIIQDSEEAVTIICRNQSEYVSMEQISQFFGKGYSTKGKDRGIGLYDIKRILEDKGDIIATNRVIDEKNYIEFKIEINR